MSSYKRIKALRIKFPKCILEGKGVKSPYDIEEEIESLGVKIWSWGSNELCLESSEKDYYIDYTLRKHEGDGEYRMARFLTEKEFEKAKPLFDKLNISLNNEDIRLVDFCYYDGCDAPDCWEIRELPFNRPWFKTKY